MTSFNSYTGGTVRYFVLSKRHWLLYANNTYSHNKVSSSSIAQDFSNIMVMGGVNIHPCLLGMVLVLWLLLWCNYSQFSVLLSGLCSTQIMGPVFISNVLWTMLKPTFCELEFSVPLIHSFCTLCHSSTFCVLVNNLRNNIGNFYSIVYKWVGYKSYLMLPNNYLTIK
jgi:hypothetical protein